MRGAELSQGTTVKIQEKVNLIWSIAANYRCYRNHFSNNVIDVIEKLGLDKEITKLSKNESSKE